MPCSVSPSWSRYARRFPIDPEIEVDLINANIPIEINRHFRPNANAVRGYHARGRGDQHWSLLNRPEANLAVSGEHVL